MGTLDVWGGLAAQGGRPRGDGRDRARESKRGKREKNHLLVKNVQGHRGSYGEERRTDGWVGKQ